MDKIRPPFVWNISAMACPEDDTIYYIDDFRGTLNRIGVSQENLEIINHRASNEFKGATALWVGKDIIQYAAMNELFSLQIKEGEVFIQSRHILKEVDQIVGIIHQQDLCFVADKNGLIVVYDDNMSKVESWNVNRQVNSMTFHKHGRTQGLFLLDNMNRSVYVYDLHGNHLFSITVPHEGATSIASVFSSMVNEPVLYISYAYKTWEIYDNTDPESSTGNFLNIQIDKNAHNAFVEPLCYKHKKLADGNSLCLSNGYRVEFKNYIMLSPRHDVLPEIRKLKPSVRMSIPTNSPRQTVISVESLGQVHGNITADDDGEDVIEFAFTDMQMDREEVVFGYKAVLNLYNIRYMIDHAPFPSDFPNDVKKFLCVEKKLDMHRKEFKEIAANILSSMPEAHRRDILMVVRNIREYVYEKLEYRYNNRDTSPLQTLKDGEGTCGKYTELLMGLLRLCGVPCRAIGDYKVPDYKLEYGILHTVCRPDYDHVWLEFYVSDMGWIPMESSSDDLPGKHNRFFAALPWVHIESSRTEKSREVIVPGTWKAIDKRFNFSDYFEHDITITVVKELYSDICHTDYS
jgi:transglutaminase-like putative cysteine protease